uniref:HDC14466 n=1 Tax=Drosophila melanogaster TaxID=7227 RepID=Q6IJQ0_DROME|nr:TPA_inf: HDC14466 [Drosophila melanogaster]
MVVEKVLVMVIMVMAMVMVMVTIDRPNTTEFVSAMVMVCGLVAWWLGDTYAAPSLGQDAFWTTVFLRLGLTLIWQSGHSASAGNSISISISMEIHVGSMIIERHLLVIANFGSGHCNDSQTTETAAAAVTTLVTAISYRGFPCKCRAMCWNFPSIHRAFRENKNHSRSSEERGKHRCIYYPREVASISENQLTHRDVARRRIGAQEESVPRKRTHPLEKSTCTTGNDLRSPAIYHTMPPHRPHTPPIWIC